MVASLGHHSSAIVTYFVVRGFLATAYDFTAWVSGKGTSDAESEARQGNPSVEMVTTVASASVDLP